MRAPVSETGAGRHVEGTVDCPLCSLDASSETAVYSHLLVSHRKSAIATALLNGDGDE